MQSNFTKAFEKAFSLIIEKDILLGEIISTTLHMAILSSLLAFLIGMPIGLLLASSKFKGKVVLITILRTLMGLPPVAVGIFIYLLFSGTGPFGKLGLIFSVKLMIIAQMVLITPICAGMTETAVSQFSSNLLETAKGLHFKKTKTVLLIANESKRQLLAVYLFSFARAISEVGAIQIVGGNILHKTRVMTTAIALNYGSGEFTLALALAIILLVLALSINILASVLQFGFSRKKYDRNKKSKKSLQQ